MNAEAAYIREAIAAEQYDQALVQWKTYVAQLEQGIQHGAVSAEQMAELRELFEWSRLVLLSARAQLQDRWAALQGAAAYLAPPERRPGLFHTRL